MLVLSRKKGESFVINEDVEVKVLDVRGGTVRLGVSAPSCVPILRTELIGTPPKGDLGPVKQSSSPLTLAMVLDLLRRSSVPGPGEDDHDQYWELWSMVDRRLSGRSLDLQKPVSAA